MRAEHPEAPTPWIDLSTGINPWPYPLPPLDPDDWTRLPEPARVATLEAAAARAYGVGDAARVAATPGTQAAIQMLPRVLPGARVAILGFTYQEHARTWRDAGRSVMVVDDPIDLVGADVAVVVNPNNPDGRRLSPAALAAIADALASSGGTLIVDEAFVDVEDPAASIAADLPPSTIVLRSFGKTWGLAGLRLGFVLGAPHFAAEIRRAFGPWAVSGPAIGIGQAALDDAEWLAETRRRLAAAAERLDGLLADAGFTPVGGTALFRLVSHPQASAVRHRLAAAGVHVRRFPHDPTLLRFGLPGPEDHWRRLAAALAES